jgi:8-oxo-dGTP pyrophosphatase MutT (NUDIX family)
MDIRLTARVVLLNHENQIMLLKFVEPHRTFWLTPGGKIEDNESPLEAARRELFEETGVSAAEFVTPHSWYCEGIGMCHGSPTFFKHYFFLARVQSSEISTVHLNCDEKEIIQEYRWWDLDDLISSNESFYPNGLFKALEPLVYQNKVPAGTIIVTD